jgi:hypothetical protein
MRDGLLRPPVPAGMARRPYRRGRSGLRGALRRWRRGWYHQLLNCDSATDIRRIMEAMGGAGPEAPSVLGGSLSPLGWSLGFLEAPSELVLPRLRAWRDDLGMPQKVRRAGTSWPGCLHALEPLTTPWTREILAAHGDAWTVYLNNGIDGGDPFPVTGHLADLLGVRWVIATHQPMTSAGHASTQLWLSGPHGDAPLRYIRTIAAYAEDRRWSWETSGPVQIFERPAAYRAGRIRDRFSRSLLVDYLAALGISVDDDHQYRGAVTVERRRAWHPRRLTFRTGRKRAGPEAG